MTHYDGPAFYRKYRLPKKNRKLNAAAPIPEAAPIKRTYHLPSEGDAQPNRIRHTEIRQTRPSIQAQTQLPPRETDVEMRREIDVPKPSKTLTSTNDWRTDRPFRVTSVPKQLHRPVLAQVHTNFNHLMATFFKKQDDQVLLFGTAETLSKQSITSTVTTATDRLQFEHGTPTPSTTEGTAGASTETKTPVTIHDWHSEGADDVPVAAGHKDGHDAKIMGTATPESGADPIVPATDSSTKKADSNELVLPADDASVPTETTAAKTQPVNTVQPEITAPMKENVADQETTDQDIVSSHTPVNDGNQQNKSLQHVAAPAVSETSFTQPVDASGTDAPRQSRQLLETDDAKKIPDVSQNSAGGQPLQPAGNQAVAHSTSDSHKTFELTHSSKQIGGREDPNDTATNQETATHADDAPVHSDAKAILDSSDTTTSGDRTQNNAPVIEQLPPDKTDTTLDEADEADSNPVSQLPVSDTTAAKNVPTVTDEADGPNTIDNAGKPEKPAETQHGLGHSLGDILNEENAQLKDLALFQDKPDVQGDTDAQTRGYHFPSPDLLTPPVIPDESELDEWIEHQGEVLDETLAAFHVDAHVVDWTIGPTVTQFQVHLSLGVKVNKITNLTDDLKLALAAKDIRIEAPIPGKSTVGIEIPNPKTRPVMLSEVLESEAFKTSKSPLTVALGVDLFGKPQVTDLRKMPHGLIAGATGSGKSVFINSLLISLLYKATPAELRLLLIDPKAVELAPYDKLPHLLAPVISDPQAAAAALKWAVNEMDDRYDRLAAAGVRNIEQYNERAELTEEYSLKLPYIVIVIDELADLMMMASSEVQDYIVRITQKARAAGIHLLIATQRPSVDIVTGTIKNNIPTRVAFMVSSQVDSRTIIDTSGAERLLGKGDMLFLGNGASQPVRLQGTFVDDEVDRVTDFVRTQGSPHYEFDPDGLLAKEQSQQNEDELMPEVLDYIVQEQTVSTSKLQRVFSIGYNRAANMIDALENKQYISGQNGSKPRDVFLTAKQLTEMRGPRTD
ncbi:DNA translocase FtsK [Secundilactobacillus collinoides]|uniref:DNA translocase FtsK n=1 Tax=Secundilactobacillus collinoides TaxID=33960 RepID=UPI0009EDE9C5|nr:DNA translocase FtsK [Secundilactobacillus collinoides]